MTSFAELKRNNRLTNWGILLILFGVLTFGLGIAQAIFNYRHDMKQQNKIDFEDFKITIIAEYLNPHLPDSIIIEKTPVAFNIKNAVIADQLVDIYFVRMDDIYRPKGYRALNKVEVTYYSTKIEKSIPFNENRNRVNYIWDLKDKQAKLCIPVTKFQNIGEKNWIFSGSLSINKKDYNLNAKYIENLNIYEKNVLIFLFK